MREFIKNEEGSAVAETALLLPIIMGLIMFALYINMFYEGKISTSVGANEALRYAVTQKDHESASKVAKERLEDVYNQHHMKFDSYSLIREDTNRDGKYSIGDTLILKVKTKKGIWCSYDYELRARVEDDNIRRGI